MTEATVFVWEGVATEFDARTDVEIDGRVATGLMLINQTIADAYRHAWRSEKGRPLGEAAIEETGGSPKEERD